MQGIKQASFSLQVDDGWRMMVLLVLGFVHKGLKLPTEVAEHLLVIVVLYHDRVSYPLLSDGVVRLGHSTDVLSVQLILLEDRHEVVHELWSWVLERLIVGCWSLAEVVHRIKRPGKTLSKSSPGERLTISHGGQEAVRQSGLRTDLLRSLDQTLYLRLYFIVFCLLVDRLSFQLISIFIYIFFDLHGIYCLFLYWEAIKVIKLWNP